MTTARDRLEAGHKLSFGLAPVLLLMVGITTLIPRQPAWAFMWLLAIAFWAVCKLWMLGEQPVSVIFNARSGRILGWFLWPGMNFTPFRIGGKRFPRPSAGAWMFAAVKTLIGALLVWGVTDRWIHTHPMLAGWCGGIGVILMLHFGSFHLLALAWQSAGVPVRPLMLNPLGATSIGEFWGKRWNTGFHDLAHRLVFAPLKCRLGVAGATLATFAVSGVIHDLVISWPAGGGYGLPTGYFLCQGAGVLFERSNLATRLGLRRGARGWLFTMLITAAPAFWLFHPTFMREVLIPFLRVLTNH